MDVCNAAEIPINTGVCALFGDIQVAVFRVGDRLYALENLDPFSRANVIYRGIIGDRAGIAKVASPVFKQSFDLSTGQCLDDENVSIPPYQVREENGMVQVLINT